MNLNIFEQEKVLIEKEIQLRQQLSQTNSKQQYDEIVRNLYSSTKEVGDMIHVYKDPIDSIPIVKQYKDYIMPLLRKSFPLMEGEDLNNALNYSIIKHMKNHKAVIDNNYKGKTINTTVIDLCNYIISREPIITPSGVMFKKHADCENPLAKVIKKFLDGRVIYKNEMFKYPKGSEEYTKYNLLQLLAKIDANGLYGAMGNSSCILYNLYVAESITTQGRSCISAAGLLFESILANNVKFENLNEIVTFINNVCEHEERKYDDRKILDAPVTVAECFNKLMGTCNELLYIPDEEDMIIVWELLCNSSQEDLNRLYYKNNLYSFMDNRTPTLAIEYIMTSLETPFLDPNHPNEEIQLALDEFCELLKEYVYYPHQFIDRRDKYANMIRSICVITDTDSNYVYKNIA